MAAQEPGVVVELGVRGTADPAPALLERRARPRRRDRAVGPGVGVSAVEGDAGEHVHVAVGEHRQVDDRVEGVELRLARGDRREVPALRRRGPPDATGPLVETQAGDDPGDRAHGQGPARRPRPASPRGSPPGRDRRGSPRADSRAPGRPAPRPRGLSVGSGVGPWSGPPTPRRRGRRSRPLAPRPAGPCPGRHPAARPPRAAMPRRAPPRRSAAGAARPPPLRPPLFDMFTPSRAFWLHRTRPACIGTGARRSGPHVLAPTR